jgi:3-oxoacyl-[acyl-carrier protein] reductase
MRAIAIGLRAADVSVAILARTEEQLPETATYSEPGRPGRGGYRGRPRRAAYPGIVDQVERSLGPIALLVNNAASSCASGPVWVGDSEEWWRNVEINLRDPHLYSQAVLPGMLTRRQGRIIKYQQ